MPETVAENICFVSTQRMTNVNTQKELEVVQPLTPPTPVLSTQPDVAILEFSDTEDGSAVTDDGKIEESGKIQGSSVGRHSEIDSVPQPTRVEYAAFPPTPLVD